MTKFLKDAVELVNNKNATDEVVIVAVGASAGGLEALKSFFKHAPENDKNAYVVIQHLSPDYKSMMAELLKRTTSLPVVEISDGLEVKPGHIYLVPPANNLLLNENRFQLTEKPKDYSLNLPIDKFFESLATIQNEKAIGIILSGTGSDGTRGARAIKEVGGMVMVQEPSQAQFDGMPKSSISTGLVDYVLPVEKMVNELHNFISSPSLFGSDDELEYDKKELIQILKFVDKQTGLDFSEYKYSTLARRLARRLHVCKCEKLEDYYEYLIQNKSEVEVLYHEFLIGVTKFFRDRKAWLVLMKKVIPQIVADTAPGETIKVWDVACSTGEEAYSLVMCFFEEMERQGKNLGFKVFATDISKKHIEIASRGSYPESIAADVPKEFLLKYFLHGSHSYRVVEKLRKAIIFSSHNVAENPPFSNMDMVVCRNMLIYFQPELKDKTLKVLHYALKDRGVLVLGTSENLNDQDNKFAVIDRKWKIFQNISPGRDLNVSVPPLADYNYTERNGRTDKTPIESVPLVKKIGEDLHESILEIFGGASVLLDKDYNVLHGVGEFKKYANFPENGFSVNLLEMLNPNLKHIVQNILSKCRKEKRKIYYKNASLTGDAEQKLVDIIVKPFQQSQVNGEKAFLLTFIEKEINVDEVTTVDTFQLTDHTKEYVSNLEEELKQTKLDLQNSSEEIETRNEELQAANEELLASNEELQSTNEELQSVNEEINTVNAENLQKMDDLVALYTDMNNLLESTQIGTIFLDSELNIRKFTPAIKKHFSFLNSDIGRPISHFTSSIGRNRLLMRCKSVLSSGKTLERPIKSSEGRHYLRRISPYLNSEEKIDGVVITFIDIESLEKSRQKLIASEKRFKAIYEDDPVMHISVDPKSAEIIHCNIMTLEKLGYNSKEDLVGKSIFQLYKNEDGNRSISHEDFNSKDKLTNLERQFVTKDGKMLPVLLNAAAELDEEDKPRTIRYTCVDISAQKKAEENLLQQKADLERANKDLEQFVSLCSHDLQEPLATIKFGSDVLKKMYSNNLEEKGKEYLTYIEKASTRLSEQIKALLEHSRIGRHGDKKLVDMKELVEVVKYDLGKRIKDTKAKIHLGNLPKIMVHEIEMRLLFQNLISNAIKYTPKERNPEIRISAFKEENFWIFSIMDNGIGIKKENQDKIFTIFSRGEGQKREDGTGIGLAHVEKIVWLHGGSIWVDSQEGVGSTFYFKIKE